MKKLPGWLKIQKKRLNPGKRSYETTLTLPGCPLSYRKEKIWLKLHGEKRIIDVCVCLSVSVFLCVCAGIAKHPLAAYCVPMGEPRGDSIRGRMTLLRGH